MCLLNFLVNPVLCLYTEKIPTEVSRNSGCARRVRLGPAFLRVRKISACSQKVMVKLLRFR